jgi:hypothetical protein
MERREAPGVCETPYGACEAPFARRTKTGLRGPFRGARASCGRFARPAARALRLPALHLMTPLSGATTLLRHQTSLEMTPSANKADYDYMPWEYCQEPSVQAHPPSLPGLTRA